jgi:hypothetical protein
VRAPLTIQAPEYPPEALDDAHGTDSAVATSSRSIAVDELAARLGRQRIPISTAVYIPSEPGRWRLTAEGARRFAGLSIIGRG